MVKPVAQVAHLSPVVHVAHVAAHLPQVLVLAIAKKPVPQSLEQAPFLLKKPTEHLVQLVLAARKEALASVTAQESQLAWQVRHLPV